jgi:hypothetical protein
MSSSHFQAVDTATDANTPGALVKRDGSGNFTAGTIIANLTGNTVTSSSGVLTLNAATNIVVNSPKLTRSDGKDFDTGFVGQIISSVLSKAVFEAAHPGWKLMDGGDATGTKLCDVYSICTLPDAQGRSLIGAGTAGGSARTLGQTYGDVNVSHSHTTAGHTHTTNGHTHGPGTMIAKIRVIPSDSIVWDNGVGEGSNWTPDNRIDVAGDIKGDGPSYNNDKAGAGIKGTTGSATVTVNSSQETVKTTSIDVTHPVYTINYFIKVD